MFLKEIITANVHLTSKRALHLRKILIVDLKRRLNRNIFPHLSVNLKVLTDYRHFFGTAATAIYHAIIAAAVFLKSILVYCIALIYYTANPIMNESH